MGTRFDTNKLARVLTIGNVVFLGTCVLVILSGMFKLRSRAGVWDTVIDPISVFGPILLSPLIAAASLILGDRKTTLIQLNYSVVLPLCVIDLILVVYVHFALF